MSIQTQNAENNDQRYKSVEHSKQTTVHIQ